MTVSIQATFQIDGERFALTVRNACLNVEILPVGVGADATHLPGAQLRRTSSSPALESWDKPWDEPLVLALHRNGRCLPCLFFRRKEDGCRRGDQCDRCHICTLEEMKRRKHRLQRAKRAQARQNQTAPQAERSAHPNGRSGHA
ncbi:unnamed protein product [Effrenium voratum]|uniref:C3H1-type domain-containing protein n=1 Tax=Effrenium voratum TaxID=2562239 RepID=A0AA36MQR4_9DINO|nr:unnamed protein product [Effrenium voratum]